jgi:hypothetical protein
MHWPRLTSVAVMRAIPLFLGASDAMIGLGADGVCGEGNMPRIILPLRTRLTPIPFCTVEKRTLDVAN